MFIVLMYCMHYYNTLSILVMGVVLKYFLIDFIVKLITEMISSAFLDVD